MSGSVRTNATIRATSSSRSCAGQAGIGVNFTRPEGRRRRKMALQGHGHDALAPALVSNGVLREARNTAPYIAVTA